MSGSVFETLRTDQKSVGVNNRLLFSRRSFKDDLNIKLAGDRKSGSGVSTAGC
jgi:hypothetical protein